MGVLVCLGLLLSTMKPAWPLHSPSVTYFFHSFVRKCVLRDMRELLETMGTTPTRSYLEGQGEMDKGVEEGREGGTSQGERMAGEGSRRGARPEPRSPEALPVSVSYVKARPCTNSA